MSAALTTMAILKANWDEKLDYLSNFQPFVNDVLRRWPGGRPIEAGAIARNVKAEWGIEIPHMTVETLVRRANKQGLVARAGDPPQLFPVTEVLVTLPDLGELRDAALRSMNALVDKIAAHAGQQGLEWTEVEAEAALMLYLDEYATVFALRRRPGGMPEHLTATEAVSVVHSLARHAHERDPSVLDWLDQAVKGSMLANVLHLENLSERVGKLDRLVVYLDTSIVVRALEVSVPPLVDASREMLAMLRHAKVSVSVFEHTLVETEGVLRGVAENLRAPRSVATRQTATMPWQRREVLDYFLNEGKTAADVEEVIANLEPRLQRLGIRIAPTPEHTDRLTVDEKKLATLLRERVRYRTAQRHSSGGAHGNESGVRITALERDIDSLTAVHRLRNGRVARNLGRCPAVFVTNNRPLAIASGIFFGEEGLRAGVPHCLTEAELVTQVWVRSPSEAPDLPRKTILADSYAALNPPPELWERYVSRIEQMHGDGELSDDDVTNLVYSTTARSVLSDLTHGVPSRFDEEQTVGEVLVRTRDDAVAEERARTEEAQRALARTQQEANELEARLRAELEASRSQIADLRRRMDSAERARSRLRRRIGYGTLAALSATVIALPWLFGWNNLATIVADTAGLAGVLLFGLAALLPWARVRRIAAFTVTLVGLSGLVTLLVTEIRGEDGGENSPPPAKTEP